MDDTEMTSISIAYVFSDGRRGALGTGRIDGLGRITVDDPQAGQEDYLAGLIDELNAREDVVVKEPATEGEEHFGISKRRVRRSEAAFLADLKVYAARAYSLELDFDESAFDPSGFDAGRPRPVSEVPSHRVISMDVEEEKVEDALKI